MAEVLKDSAAGRERGPLRNLFVASDDYVSVAACSQ